MAEQAQNKPVERNANIRLAGQFALAAGMVALLGVAAGFIGRWVIGVNPEHDRLLMIPPAYHPMVLIFCLAALLSLVAACFYVSGILEKLWQRLGSRPGAHKDEG